MQQYKTFYFKENLELLVQVLSPLGLKFQSATAFYDDQEVTKKDGREVIVHIHSKESKEIK